jgi:hypothetical protein
MIMMYTLFRELGHKKLMYLENKIRYISKKNVNIVQHILIICSREYILRTLLYA